MISFTVLCVWLSVSNKSKKTSPLILQIYNSRFFVLIKGRRGDYLCVIPVDSLFIN